ncbi:MAG: hypothetical protein KDC53_14405 [Saprospiraceae bacterium]|nr:hypothetical protein [Saprospiraceae bacterium]
MKKSNLLLIMFALISYLGYSQTELYRGPLKKELVPEKILNSLTKDFPNVNIIKYEGIPITLVKGEIYVDSNEDDYTGPYDNYVISLDGKAGRISATYNSEGQLLNTFEHLKNVPLPKEVLATLGKDFNGWAVKGDKVKLTSYHDGKEVAHYRVKLEKNGQIENVIFDEMGKVIKTTKDLKLTM